jgi:NADH-quinone oxidoreductase subunit L
MWIPLVALAGVAALGGIVNMPRLFGIPSGAAHRLEEWLHPVVEFGEADISGTWAYDNKYVLVAIAVACALIGVMLAWLIYERKRIKPWEPTLLANAWYYDWAITWFMGNPGREAFQAVADFDATIVDGAVTGSGVAVKAAATEARKSQSGYVRQYAAIIAVGVVLLLGWFVVFRGIL